MPQGRVSAWDTPPSTGTAASRTPFGEGQIRRPRRGGSILVVALALSLSMHLGFVIAAAISQLGEDEKPAEAHTFEIVDASELNYRPPVPAAEIPDIELPKNARLVELPEPATKENAPKDARFLAEHDHAANEETRARDTALTPEVLADAYKGLGKDASKGDAPTQGKNDHVGENDGADERTAKGDAKSEKRIDEVLASDPFGIRARPRHSDAEGGAWGPGGEAPGNHEGGQVAQVAAGNGAKVAMAGAPNNDYLPDVREGDKTQLAAKEFVFASFWHRVQRAVEPFWVSNVRAVSPGQIQRKDYMTRVNVTLTGDGRVIAVEIVRGCGVPAWDRAVVDAFNEASPFLNPPPQLVSGDGKIHMDDLGFVVSLTGGQVVHMYGDPRAGKLFPGVREGYGPGR